MMLTVSFTSLMNILKNEEKFTPEVETFLKGLVSFKEPFNVLTQKDNTTNAELILYNVLSEIKMRVDTAKIKRFSYRLDTEINLSTTMTKLTPKHKVYLYDVAFTKGNKIIGYENVDNYGNLVILGDYFTSKVRKDTPTNVETINNFKKYLKDNVKNDELGVYLLLTQVNSKVKKKTADITITKLNLAWR